MHEALAQQSVSEIRGCYDWSCKKLLWNMRNCRISVAIVLHILVNIVTCWRKWWATNSNSVHNFGRICLYIATTCAIIKKHLHDVMFLGVLCFLTYPITLVPLHFSAVQEFINLPIYFSDIKVSQLKRMCLVDDHGLFCRRKRGVGKAWHWKSRGVGIILCFQNQWSALRDWIFAFDHRLIRLLVLP